MSRIEDFYPANRDLVIDVINNGKIRRDEIYELFKKVIKNPESSDNEIFFIIYKFLIENPKFLDYDRLSEITGLKGQILKEIFENKHTKVFFPVVNNEHSNIATAYVIKTSYNHPFNCFSKVYQEDLEVIKSFIKSKNKDFSDFFVFFDKNFKGKSFMLAVVSALLLPEELLKNYCFTGRINEKGRILEVDYIPEKTDAAERKNLKLISHKTAESIDDIIFYLSSNEIDIPFIILNQEEFEIKKSIKKIENKIKESKELYSLEKIEKFFDLKMEDLYLQTVDIKPDPVEWENLLNLFKQKLIEIYKKLPSPTVTLHIATSVSTLSFGLGIITGSKRSYILYHFQNDKYFPVFVLNTLENIKKIRKPIKDIFNSSKYLAIEERRTEKKSDEVNLILYTANSDLKGETLNFIGSSDYVYIELKKFQGNIPPDPDVWTGIVSELFSVINTLKNEYGRINLFMSCPTILSFALGMAVGHFVNISVFHYYRETGQKYIKVFNTLKLKPVV